MELLYVVKKKNVHIFTQLFQEIESYRLTQRYYELDNNCVHNSRIFNRRVKISTRKFMMSFSDAIVNKKNLILELLIQ